MRGLFHFPLRREKTVKKSKFLQLFPAVRDRRILIPTVEPAIPTPLPTPTPQNMGNAPASQPKNEANPPSTRTSPEKK